MKKLGIIVDSFCGHTKKHVEKYPDTFFIPLRVIVDGEEIKDGIDMEMSALMKKLDNGKEVKTSQPSPKDISEAIEKASKEYENVIYFAVSTALSGTANTAKMLSKDIKNIEVVPHTMIGDYSLIFGQKLISDMNDGLDFASIMGEVKKISSEFPTYVIPKSNEALLRGGRLPKSIAYILTKLKTVPVIGFEDNEKLHKKGIKRSGIKAIKFVIDKIEKTISSIKFDYEWTISHTLDEEFSMKARKLLLDKGYKVDYQLTSGVIDAHVGSGAMSLGLRRIFNKKKTS